MRNKNQQDNFSPEKAEQYFSFFCRAVILNRIQNTLLSLFGLFCCKFRYADFSAFNDFLHSEITLTKKNCSLEYWNNYYMFREHMKEGLKPGTFKDSIKNILLNCFDYREDIDTRKIDGLYFENPFSIILRGHLEPKYTAFENCFECLRNEEFKDKHEKLKARREKKRLRLKKWIDERRANGNE